MHLKINTNSISFFFFCLAIICIPINFDYFSLRLTDIFIQISFFILLLSGIKKKQYILFSYFFLIVIVYFLSYLFGEISNLPFNIDGFFFFFKWFSIFSSIYLVYYFINYSIRNLNLITTLIYYVLIFLILWVYIYLYLVANNLIVGSIRVSFPLSRDPITSDAHLYSSLLSFFLLTYIFFLNRIFNHSKLYSIIIFILGLIALLLTGSRNGIIFLFIGTFFCTISYIFRFFLLKSSNKFLFIFRYFIFIFIFSISLFILMVAFDIDYQQYFTDNQLFERALNFDFNNDTSANSRLDKLKIASDIALKQFYIFGVSPLYSPINWYDGIFSILLAHGGIALLLIFLTMFIHTIIFILNQRVSKLNKIYLIIFLFIYLFMNFVTEYIFVSRNFFPILILFLISTYNKKTNLN